MTNYKVLISSAGIGSRLKAHTQYRNKGLVTLGLKPALSHIIEKFDKEVPIVIAVGYKKDALKEIISEAHGDRNIEFVTVENYDGEGSGLGHSMLCCEDTLQCPFIFIPNDTIIPNSTIDIDPSKVGNWIGNFDNSNNIVDVSHYRCSENIKSSVLSILPKGLETNNVYIGLCGIKDYRQFWDAMRSSRDAISEGESFGLNALENKVSINFNDWKDVGNITALNKAADIFRTDGHNILPKIEEAIWMFTDRCIKYHNDHTFISERIARTNFLPENLLPQIVNSGKNYFSYRYVEGNLLSRTSDVKTFVNFLECMEKNLWNHRKSQIENGKRLLIEFYKEKTFYRVKAYLNRFDQNDNITHINGHEVVSVDQLLREINWDEFYKGTIWSHFHGDLHGENILFSDINNFKLLDWRQNFGENNLEFGDLYYDLGKILHGLIVRHEIVSQNCFKVQQVSLTKVNIDIDNSFGFIELQEKFKTWVIAKNYDYQRVQIVCALIFLNIAALHHYPYSRFLYLLGQYLLNKACKNERNCNVSNN